MQNPFFATSKIAQNCSVADFTLKFTRIYQIIIRLLEAPSLHLDASVLFSRVLAHPNLSENNMLTGGTEHVFKLGVRF
jgi:hypothetical protein